MRIGNWREIVKDWKLNSRCETETTTVVVVMSETVTSRMNGDGLLLYRWRWWNDGDNLEL